MSNFIGIILILAAGGGVVYFGYTLIRDIIGKVRERRNGRPPTDKK